MPVSSVSEDMLAMFPETAFNRVRWATSAEVLMSSALSMADFLKGRVEASGKTYWKS